MTSSTNGNGNTNWQDWLVQHGLDEVPTRQSADCVQGAEPIQAPQAPHTTQTAAATTAQTAQPLANAVPSAASNYAAAPANASARPVQAAQAAQHAQTGQPSYGTANKVDAKAQAKAQAKTAKDAARQAKRANKQANKQGGGFKTFALGFLGAACAFALGLGVLAANGVFDKPGVGTVSETVSDGGTVVLGSETNTAVMSTENHTESLAEAVADKVLPSIVGIDIYATTSNDYNSFWGGGSSDTEALAGLGSGVVISKDGYILTNYHVVEGASKLMATVGGEEREAKVVGADESSDLAVIKVEAADLVPVEIGSSANLRPGQWVMTLGSPFGLEQSVATGIISATSRTVVVQNSNSMYGYGQQVQPSIYSNMIQTDAAINPGNSGGALVDENGKLIGINSVIESYSGSYSGVGFAIPVDYAMNIATQIIDGKTPTHAQLGVSATTIDKDIAERYNLGANSGAYINKVYDDSGAQAAGLEQGDIIVKISGVAVESSTDLIGQVRAHNPGETVAVTIVRGSETKEVEVTLGSDENTASYTEEEQSLQNQQMPNDGYHNRGQGSEDESDKGFNYKDLEELFNYFNQRR